MKPEERARKTIDALLEQAGWVIQDRHELNLTAARGVAVREFPLGTGTADYLLFVNEEAVGVIEAKKAGQTLIGVEEQSEKYLTNLPAILPTNREKLPFSYETTGIETRFTNHLDPEPCSRRVFAFHRPDKLAEWLAQAPEGVPNEQNKSAEQFSREPADKQNDCNYETVKEAVEGILQTYADPQSLKKKLEDLCMHLAVYEQQIIYPFFFELLTEVNPELGCELCRLLVEDPSSCLANHFTELVTPIRTWNTKTFLNLVCDALTSDNSTLRQRALYALCAYREYTNEESDIIITLIKDIDTIVASRAIYIIPQLSEKVQDRAFSALDDISIAPEREKIVDAICKALHQRMNTPAWNPLPTLISFLQKCVPLPEHSEQKHYSLCSLLLECRWQYPQIIANFCLERVKYRRSLPEEQRSRYESISCISTYPAPEGKSAEGQNVEERYKVLCLIRDQLLEFDEGELIMIFAFFANGYDATALQVLSEWLKSGEEQKIFLITRLIRAAPTPFIFENEEFVNQLLSTGSQINKSINEQIRISLLHSAMPFNVVGTPDLLSSGRIQIRESARQIAAKYPSNSAMHEFYTNLSREAEYRIEMQRSFMAAQ